MNTPRLSLPLLAAAQAQKHVTLNEALLTLDRTVQCAVLSRALTEPPPIPAEGASYMVPAGPSGAWAGHGNKLATWSVGGWDFYVPPAGFVVWIVSESILAVWDGALWRTLGESAGRLGINTTADATNRLAVASPATLLTHAGQGHQLKINKASAADNASLLFQSAFSGRAEFGVPSGNDFEIKVSADGTVWRTALRVDAASGTVVLPQTPRVETRQLLTAVLASTFSTTSATPVATGLGLTLTPTAAASRIRVSGHVTLGADFWFTAPQVSIFRNGVKVWPAGSGFLDHQLLADTASNSAFVSMTCPINFIETLATTAAANYEVRLSSRTAGTAAHLNRRHLDTLARGDSRLIVEELSP